ncbi:hypothetical protein [Peribacillus simplex]|uniref:hypothetical protein n=1 Tax=Peribacillus simplex TaxID=1478 RepID=UPI003D2D7004
MKNKTAVANGEIIMIQVAITRNGKFQSTCQLWTGGNFTIEYASSIEQSITKSVLKFLKEEKVTL